MNTRPSKISLNNSSQTVNIQWIDGHLSEYSIPWLSKTHGKTAFAETERQLWGKEIVESNISVSFEKVMESDQGLAIWLKNIRKYGIGFVENCPTDPKRTEELCKRIAFIRQTHYGAFWDFTANMEHGDTAYSSIALAAHTDTSYFTDPVGLQIFHLLEHRGTGGQSLFVDGFKCAQQLKAENPTHYEILSTLGVPSHCAGDENTIIRPYLLYPILNHDPINGELTQIRFNNNDRSVLNTIPNHKIEAFYRALQHWMEIIKSSENEFWIQLKPNQVVAFDNWRVLHGRSAFSGYRRMVGCYINRDDFESRIRTIVEKGLERDLI